MSGLFGGGGTKVNQTAQNKTDVNVDIDIENIIDTKGIEEVFKSFEATQAELVKQNLITNLLKIKEVQQKEEVKNMAFGIRDLALISAGSYFVYRMFK